MQSFARCTNAKLQKIKEPCSNKSGIGKLRMAGKGYIQPSWKVLWILSLLREGIGWEALHGIKAVILGGSGDFMYTNSFKSCVNVCHYVHTPKLNYECVCMCVCGL